MTLEGTCKIVEAKVFEVQKFTFALQFTTHVYIKCTCVVYGTQKTYYICT